MTHLKSISSKANYTEALHRLNIIFDAKLVTPEIDEAELLSLLLEDYEGKFYRIAAPNPIDAIRISMEEMEHID